MKAQALVRGQATVRQLRAALDAVGIGYGDAFLIAHPDVLAVSEDAAHARASDPDTSKLATLVNLPNVGSQRRRCLDFIVSRGSATGDELTIALDFDAWKRLSELKQGGWVEPSGEQRVGSKGARADVYVPTAKALARADVS